MDKDPEYLTIKYLCPNCNLKWEEQWTCACDSECPNCGLSNIMALSWDTARGKRLFRLGEVVATPAALAALDESGQTPDFFFDRHAAGQWGLIDQDDARLNDKAVRNGNWILSVYQTLKGKTFWIITESDRSVTTLLLPEER